MSKTCKHCKMEYVGRGKSFCSNSCSAVARPYRKRGPMTEERKRHISEAKKGRPAHQNTIAAVRDYHTGRFGRDSVRWIDDRSLIGPRHLRKTWGKEVLNRDGGCMIGVGCSGRLESHHILPWRLHPEARSDIRNGITLCSKHHPKSRVAELEMVDLFRHILTRRYGYAYSNTV